MVPVARNCSSRQILMKRNVSHPQPGAVPMFSDYSRPSLFPLTGGRGNFQNCILNIWGDLCARSAHPHIQRPCGSTSALSFLPPRLLQGPSLPPELIWLHYPQASLYPLHASSCFFSASLNGWKHTHRVCATEKMAALLC